MLSLQQLILLLSVTLGGVLLSLYYDIWLCIGILPGMMVLLFYCIQVGFSIKELTASAMTGISQVKIVAYILLLVSFMIPCWMAAGVISYMISVGLELIEPSYFLTCAFIVTSVVALILGTSTGSLSAIGVPLMGMGTLLGLPPVLTGGAVVSGAFVGDRTSPLASANQLVAGFAGISMEKQMRVLFPTSVLSIVATIFFYYVLDQFGGWQGGVLYGEIGKVWSYFGWLLLVPPLLMMGAIICRINTISCFWLAIISGIILGTWYQGVNLEQWIQYFIFGFQKEDGTLFLEGRGSYYMLPLILFILLTGAFNGILDYTGLIRPYLEKVLNGVRSLGQATFRLGIFGFILNGICCNQTMPIMITAGSLRSIWLKSFSASQLSRVVSDTSLVLAGLVPWNLFAMICSSILGVPVLGYSPYAAFLWFTPAATLIWSIYCNRATYHKLKQNS